MYTYKQPIYVYTYVCVCLCLFVCVYDLGKQAAQNLARVSRVTHAIKDRLFGYVAYPKVLKSQCPGIYKTI